ncbi:MAG: carbon storage regulator [Bryobacteraceae bacterium]
MLVIRRRPGESVLIGDGIEIEILEAGGGQVKLGIRAPKEIPVLRKEVWLTGCENEAASHSVTQPSLAGLVEKVAEWRSRT